MHTAQVPNFSAAAIKRQMRKALLLIATATAIRPTTRRAALGAITTVPTAAVAYDSKNYDNYASSYDDLDGGQAAKAGAIIVRQCGTRFKAGYLVQRCKDDTLMARVEGTVRFRGRTVDIVPACPSVPRYEVVDNALAAKAASN